jgi:hypothetical protein
MQLQFLDFVILLRQRFQIINSQISEIKPDEVTNSLLNNSGFFGASIKKSTTIDSHQTVRKSAMKIQANNLATNAISLLEENESSVIGDLPVTTITYLSQVASLGTLHAVSHKTPSALSSVERDAMSRVRFLAHLHDSLCDTAQLLNSFSVQNLICSAICLTDMTVNFYSCFVVLLKLRGMNTLR